VFDPKWSSKFKECGISVLDAPSEIVGAMLAYMGKDPNSQVEADLKAAEAKLMAIRPNIRMIHSSNYIDALANGEICLAVGWSGDVLQARDRADEAGQGNVIKYSVPKEGTIMWFDMYAIPADAKHPDNAHTFINFMMRPEVAAAKLEPGQLRERQCRHRSTSSTSRSVPTRVSIPPPRSRPSCSRISPNRRNSRAC
jgi:putrescine transport system substrate-binding protein